MLINYPANTIPAHIHVHGAEYWFAHDKFLKADGSKKDPSMFARNRV